MATPLTKRSAATRVVHFPGFLPWLLLMALTLFSWSLGAGHGVGTLVTISALILAFFKVSVVGRYFMELRFAPRALTLIFQGWAVFVCAVLIGIYLVVR